MAVAFGPVLGLAVPLLLHRPLRVWPWPPAAFFFLFGLVWPLALAPVYKAWMWLGYVLGYFNSRIILGVVFFVVITPLGIALKLLRRDPLERKIEPAAETYRKPRAGANLAEEMERPF